MRLTPEERRAIESRIGDVVVEMGGALYLFGSRADDAKRGGDIDLLVVLPAENLAAFAGIKRSLIDRVHGDVGEQRIDVTLTTATELASDPFLAAIEPQLIRLR